MSFFSVAGSSILEGNLASFTFENVGYGIVAPSYITIDGTASTANGDYTQIFGSANIPALGSAVVSTATTADASVEAPERFGLLVLPESADDMGLNVAASIATVIIRDGGPAPAVVDTVQLLGPGSASATLPTLHVRDAAMFEGTSGSRILAFLVSLDHWTSGPVQFSYSLQDGTATAASGDFVATAGVGTFIGQSTVVFIQINGDATPEAAENFRLVISSVSGAVFANNAVSVSATGTIFDSSQANSGVSGGIGDFGFSIFGSGADVVSGGADVDKFDGAGGADTLSGLGGNDVLLGGDGDDRLVGGDGSDALQGQAGNDSYVLGAEASGVDFVIDSAGIDTITSTISRSLAFADYAEIENLVLSGGAAGTGNALRNTITGNAAANTLSGGIGNDVLRGQGGADVLVGGTGVDTLTGGAQNDYFFFNAPVVAANRDVITDFANVTGNNDTIRLENAVFTRVGAPGVLQPTAFKLSTQLKDADDHIIYNKATGALYYDPDGSGSAAPVQFATLTTKPTLTFHDFVVV